MSRLNDRPAGRRPRAPESARPPARRPQLPPAVKKGIDWCDRVRFATGPARHPADEWGDWADEIISLADDAEGGAR